MKYQKVSIIGAGFMGACLALDLRDRGLCDNVVALARNEQRAEELAKLGIFSAVSADLESVLADAQIIIIATPVKTIASYIAKIHDFCSRNNPDAVLTDIGSTTGEVYSSALKMVETGYNWLHNHFISSHPICGSEYTGAEHAKLGLYDGSMCVLTPFEGESAAVLEEFWGAVGSNVSVLAPCEHDKILAYTSHLPHVMSFAYAAGFDKGMLPYTAGSFRDMTRIANAGTDIWKDILLSNKESIVAAIDEYRRHLDDLELYIQRGDVMGLTHFLDDLKNNINE